VRQYEKKQQGTSQNFDRRFLINGQLKRNHISDKIKKEKSESLYFKSRLFIALEMEAETNVNLFCLVCYMVYRFWRGALLYEIIENVDNFFMHLIIGSGPQTWGSPPTWGLGWVLTSVLTGHGNCLGSFEISK
jgi:hypothetical protein